MALLGKLIVNIDADLKGLRNQIKAAESVMRQSAKSLGALSSQLSTSISLPLAAIGVGAIKSAADMERLNSALASTMEAAGRSSQDATKELEALRQAALAPGLDFEQAVKGSVRLQNVGFSAEKARNILVQLANAVAITGGQAQELDGVTRQFGQMIAKGRILQEDLSIIQENMPAIAQAMEKAFGTKSAEQLRNMGVSAEQFVDGVTNALSELPRVTGGLANSIVNAMSAVKLAAAQVGEVLNKQFGISERLNAFAAFLGELSQGFQALDSSTQSAILGVAAFALALGPAIKAGSLLVSTIGGVSVSIAKTVQFFNSMLVSTSALTKEQIALNAAMRANVFGVLVGVALALGAAYVLLSKNTDAAVQAQEAVAEVQNSAAKSVAEQTVRTNALVAIMESENATYQQKKYALDELQKISPAYFGNIKIGAYETGQATEANKLYAVSLLKVAEAQAAQRKLSTLSDQGIDVDAALKKAQAAQKELDSKTGSSKIVGVLSLAVNPLLGLNAAKSFSAGRDVSRLEAELAGINAQKEALTDLIIANEKTAASNNDLSQTEKELNAERDRAAAAEAAAAKRLERVKAAQEAATKAAGVYRESLADIQKEIDKAAITGADALEAEATAIQSAIDKLLDVGFSKSSKEVDGLIERLKKLQTLRPLAELTKTDTFETQASEIARSLDSALASGFKAGDKEVDALLAKMRELNTKLRPADAPAAAAANPASPIQPVPTEVLDSYARLPEYLQVWQDKVNETQLVMDTFWESNGAAMQIASEAMVEFGSTIENSLADANTSWNDFGQAAKAAIVGVIGNLIKLAVANAVTKAFANSPNPLLGAALAALAGGLAAGLFKRLVGSAKFATGTLSAPGGRALVGEEGPELLNLPSSSGLRIPGKQTAAVLGAFERAAGSVRNVQQAAQNGLTVVGQNGPEYVNLPAGAQVIPATQTREVLQSLSRSVTDRTSTTTNTVRSTVNRDIAERIRRGLAVPAYAVGTLGAKGGRSLVGERGPELVNLPNLSGVKIPALQAAKVMEAVSRQFSETRSSDSYSTLSDTVRNFATNNVVNNRTLSDTVRNNLINSEINTTSRTVSEAVRNLVANSQVSRASSTLSDVVRNSVANSRVTNATSTLSESVRNAQIFNKLNIPQFAAGTLSAPGGLSLVGEFGPELVNLARGAQVLPSLQTERVIETLQGGGGTQQVQVGGTFRMDGTDMLLVLEKAARNRNRVR